MSENVKGVLCAGSIVADILVRPVSEIGWGQTTWVDTVALNLGGNGASTSYTMAKLGLPVVLLGAVGRDQFGDNALSKLAAVGVDVSYVSRPDNLPTAVSVALVHPDGSRALLQQPGASREAIQPAISLTDALLAQCSHLHLANIFALQRFQSHAPELLAQARRHGLRTSMDAGWDPQGRWMNTLAPCLAHTGSLFLNRDEAVYLTGLDDPRKAAQLFLERGVSQVIVKLGPLGCLVVTETDSFAVPAFQIEPVDTTGAGDCFAGAFIAAQHRDFDLRAAALFANAAGALSAQGLGAVSGILTFDETVRWMRQAL